MPVETAEDLAVFFDTDEFATEVVLEAPDGSETSVPALHDSPGRELDVGAGVAIASTEHSLLLRRSDAPAVAQGWKVRLDGRAYRVVNVPPTSPSAGDIARLELHRE